MTERTDVAEKESRLAGPVDKPIVKHQQTLADRTIARVRECLSNGETACVAQVIELVREMSEKADRLSVQDLADIIGRDLTTMTKIMRAANCLGYNPDAIGVSTLTRAILVIGFEQIRNLAISLLLLENAENRHGTSEGRAVAAHALSAALLAQAIVRRTTVIDPEQAFVCAALRHYGKLLLCTFLPEDYRHALRLAAAIPPDKAFHEVFGLTPLRLAQDILSEPRLPNVIMHSLQPVPSDKIRARDLSEEDRLLVISEFSMQWCELQDAPLTAAEIEIGSTQLLKAYERSLELSSEVLNEVVQAVGQKLELFERAQGTQTFSSPLIQKIQTLARGQDTAEKTDSTNPSGTKGPASPGGAKG